MVVSYSVFVKNYITLNLLKKVAKINKSVNESLWHCSEKSFLLQTDNGILDKRLFHTSNTHYKTIAKLSHTEVPHLSTSTLNFSFIYYSNSNKISFVG